MNDAPSIAERVRGLQPRVPRATYRIQLSAAFTLRDAQRVVPYLSDLGISDLYLSPLLKARRASTHGYDVTDHSQIDPRLGTYEDLLALSGMLRERGMGLLLDIVPNHMGIGDGTNAWWMDVLEFGQMSPYAHYFDIDWRRDVPGLNDRVLLAVLEDQYGVVLESGNLRVERDGGAFLLRYRERSLPLTPRSYSALLEPTLDSLGGAGPAEDDAAAELESILTAIRHLPERGAENAATEGYRESAVIKRRIGDLLERDARLAAACDDALRTLNGRPGDARSFDALDDLIDAQHYRLADWRVAADEINYRRFFDINELAAIRVELPDVFADTHRLILQMVRDGAVTGLRVDHPDGLLRPAEYFERLQAGCAAARLGFPDAGGEYEQVVDATRAAGGPPPTYVVAEKILEHGERLDADWAVYGTTGYDFLNQLNRLFVQRSARRAFDRMYEVFTGRGAGFREIALTSKKLVMLTSFAGEVHALGRQLDELASRNRRYRDFTLNTLLFALREVIAALPVYRTYISTEPAPHDVAYIEAAVRSALRANPRTSPTVFAFLRDTLLLRNIESFQEDDREDVREFVLKFQQLTGPVMAKGVEDTASYVYNRLISLNEVGGDPAHFGGTAAEFHASTLARARAWPHAMLATTTHDTKRSEDTRARIDVLSELPAEWRAAVQRWSTMNQAHKSDVDGVLSPDSNDEFLFYQSMAGIWPAADTCDTARLTERLLAYMLKAVREAKAHTSWVAQNTEYEAAVERFVRGALSTENAEFIEDVHAFVAGIAIPGYVNSLAQRVIAVSAPGAPDLYQGCESWSFTLVDPDNRRPVDFARLAECASMADSTSIERMLAAPEDRVLKVFVTRRALRVRATHEELFRHGEYAPLAVTGTHAGRVLAFARRLDGKWCVCVTPRLIAPLCREHRWPVGSAWGDTAVLLPRDAPEAWRCGLTEQRLTAERRRRSAVLTLSQVLARLPAAMLINEGR